MHELSKKLIDLGATDTAVEVIKVDEWFHNVEISFSTRAAGKVHCLFEECFEVSLRHDLSYSKNIRADGSKDYKYYIQDIGISEVDSGYTVKISAWPLEGQVVCKKISIKTERW